MPRSRQAAATSARVACRSATRFAGSPSFGYLKNPSRTLGMPDAAVALSTRSPAGSRVTTLVVTMASCLLRFPRASTIRGRSSSTRAGAMCVEVPSRTATSTPSQPTSATRSAVASKERSINGFVKPMSGNDRASGVSAAGASAAGSHRPAAPAKTPAADEARNTRRDELLMRNVAPGASAIASNRRGPPWRARKWRRWTAPRRL